MGIFDYFVSNTWTLAVAIVALVTYIVASRRSRLLPELPLELFVLYLVLTLLHVALKDAAWATDWAKWLSVSATIAFSWAIVRLVFALAVELPVRVRSGLPLPKITRDFILAGCFVVLAIILLRTEGDVNLAGLITTSAVLTAVIGLAAQTTLSNLFAGLSLQIERPFRIGDWIQYGNHIGQVISITWKSTRLLTRKNVQIYVPNSDISGATFYNYSQPDDKIIGRLLLGVEYGAPPNKVRKVVMDVLAQHPKIHASPVPEIRLVEFGDFAITYEIRFWHHDVAGEPRIKADINNPALVRPAKKPHQDSLPHSGRTGGPRGAPPAGKGTDPSPG